MELSVFTFLMSGTLIMWNIMDRFFIKKQTKELLKQPKTVENLAAELDKKPSVTIQY